MNEQGGRNVTLGFREDEKKIRVPRGRKEDSLNQLDEVTHPKEGWWDGILGFAYFQSCYVG